MLRGFMRGLCVWGGRRRGACRSGIDVLGQGGSGVGCSSTIVGPVLDF